jgi:hypothetical protein
MSTCYRSIDLEVLSCLKRVMSGDRVYWYNWFGGSGFELVYRVYIGSVKTMLGYRFVGN